VLESPRLVGEDWRMAPLTRDQRAQGVAESFATLRLSGLEPSPAAIRDADDYIEGRRTLEEIIDDVIARHRRP
jgi:hypothetical protein